MKVVPTELLEECVNAITDYIDGHPVEGWRNLRDALRQCLSAAPIAPPVAQEVALTFDAFRAANVARCVKWHPAGIASWSPSDWLVAVTGELGELASLLKMRNRERDGLPGNKFSPTDKMVADELADVLTYLDLLAETLGVNLGQAATVKFNEVSERVGFPDRIDAHPPRRELPDEIDKVLANWECEDRPIDSKFAAMAIRAAFDALRAAGERG